MPHLHEKIDFTADVFIIHQNKVLLRKHEKYHLWLVPGGHIELNEDPVEAAVREVKEEVGLDVTIANFNQKAFNTGDGSTELTPPVFMNRHRINANHEHISFIYFAVSQTDHVVVDPTLGDASHEYKWVTKEELITLTDLLPTIKFYAEYALTILST